MSRKHISLSNSLVKNSDKTSDGNLRPEARQRILTSIKEHLQCAGRANISEMARMLDLSRPTVKSLVDEVLLDWGQDIQDQNQILFQAKWMESVIRDIDQNPDAFDKEKIAVVNLKASLFSKLNVLQKLALKKDLHQFNLYLIKQASPKELPNEKPPP